jgi:ABC-2 type transport system permease protein
VSGAVRMEARRVATVRPVQGLVAASVVVGALSSLFLAASRPAGPLAPDVAVEVLTAGASVSIVPLPAVLLAAVGIMAVAEDFRCGLLTVLLVAQPRRGALLAARLLVIAAACAVSAALQVAVAWAASALVGRPATPDAAGLRSVALFLVTAAAAGWAGAALAGLTRSTAGPVALLLLDALLLEPGVTLAADTVRSPALAVLQHLLPLAAIRQALARSWFAGATGPTGATGAAAGLGVLAAYLAVLLGLAWVAFRRRDVG